MPLASAVSRVAFSLPGIWGFTKPYSNQGTEVHFANFLSGGFTTMVVINSQESKRTSMLWTLSLAETTLVYQIDV